MHAWNETDLRSRPELNEKRSAKLSAHSAYKCLAVYIASCHAVLAAPRASCIGILCLVWGKAEPAIRPFRTILHDALNGQTASSDRPYFMPNFLNARAALQKCVLNTPVQC